MTGNEFKKWAEMWGLTIPDLCRELGISRKNCTDYLRRGDRRLPRLITLAVDGWVMMRDNRSEWDR